MPAKPPSRRQSEREFDRGLAAYSATNQATLARQKDGQKGSGHRLAIYTGAAGAALAGAFSAEAAIEYQDVNWAINTGNSETFDMGDGGGNDVKLAMGYSPIATFTASAFRVGTAAIAATAGGDAQRFVSGSVIGTGGQAWQNTARLFRRTVIFWNDGNSRDTQTGYLGLRFGSGPTKYGWIHIDAINAGGSNYHVDDYAYQSDGTTIQAGEMPPVVPEPSTIALALLASGAAGVMRSRRKKILKGRSDS